MESKQYNTIETFKKSFKDVFAENVKITLDHTFGELAEMQELIKQQQQLRRFNYPSCTRKAQPNFFSIVDHF